MRHLASPTANIWFDQKPKSPNIVDVNLSQSDHFGEGVTDGLDTRLAYEGATRNSGLVAIHAPSSSVGRGVEIPARYSTVKEMSIS